MNTNRLIGEIAQPISAISLEDSLFRAVRIMRELDLPLIPVTLNGRLMGTFGTAELTRVLGDGADLAAPVSEYMVPGPVVRRYQTTAEALRMFEAYGSPILLVLDANEVLAGYVSPAMLSAPMAEPIRPPMVGGMATPFGVYLTTGGVSGGVPKWALVATGSLMFSLLFLGSLLGNFVAERMEGFPIGVIDGTATVVSLATFLVGLRVLPLSGTHGAEHQVVHAIERGEVLRPEIVRRMPRVHPRCGTNIAAAAMLFLGIAGSEWGPDLEVRFLVAVVTTLALWRVIGSALQRYVTTRRPSDRQLTAGIGSGEDLLTKYARASLVTPSIPSRIWNSGMIQVMAGSLGTYGIIWLICKAFGWTLPIL